MTDKTTKRILVSAFLVIGILLMGARWMYFEADRVLDEDTAWKISLTGRFETEKDVTIITSARPKSGKYTRVISQHLYYPGLKLLAPNPGMTGVVRVKSTRSGITEFLLEYHIQLSKTPKPKQADKPPLTLEERENYLKSAPELDLTLPSLTNLNEYIVRGTDSKTQLIKKIFQQVQKPVRTVEVQFNDLKSIILQNRATSLGRAKLMIALCRLNNIPARLVTGLILAEKEVASPHYWLEIYNDNNLWIPYDTEKGFEEEIPANYIVHIYETPEIFSIENGKLLSVRYSIAEDLDILNVARIKQEQQFLDILDLRRLDFETRQTLIKILILPFCVLLTAFLRHVIGLYPYGTFTAPLLALAMVYAEATITLVVAGIIIFLATLGRSILPRTCARAPRLSLIFTFVAISMVFSISLLSYFSIETGGNIILLPTIILVSVVDRFYSYMDQSGTHAALLRLGVTVMIAVLCIPILKLEDLGVWILGYPEAHLITAALVLILSGYAGKKLTDNRYLALLGENKPVKKPRKQTKTETEEV